MSLLGSVLSLHVLVDGLADDLPGPPIFGPRTRVALTRRARQLALHLSVTRQALSRQVAVGERGPDRASRLALVPAIAEPARGRDVDDVVEGGLDTFVGTEDLERPDTRCVDEQGAAREFE